jgi:cell division topological specificity factor
MKWLNFFFKARQDTQSANTAKERLQVIVAHDHLSKKAPDYLAKMQQEIMAVIAKYTKIDANLVNLDFEQKDGCSVIGLNVTLPETTQTEKPKAKTKAKPKATKKETAAA